MRIIAGSAKGNCILSPKGQRTRPTQDRVRESLFNILRNDVKDAQVLDLFAGSGALGLEAVSRGAMCAVAVDWSEEAVACITQNILKLGFSDRVRVMKLNWNKAVKILKMFGNRFDLVFIDPPYKLVGTGSICRRLEKLDLLMENALMVIEHESNVKPLPWKAFVCINTRQYGDSEISFFRYQPAPQMNTHRVCLL